ncbi:hypothetical protein C2G38_2044006 [Gigaspora rosea]|uniref:Uncharacterized protein n=1 Tax=Gigaspora rosea TaxID=44941 RepID=A0A397URL3_9GLOM|nr:hypothetical protein C2G38_2044006 [Gigaspora rosea]
MCNKTNACYKTYNCRKFSCSYSENDIIVIEDSDSDLEFNNNNMNISREYSLIEEYINAIPQRDKKEKWRASDSNLNNDNDNYDYYNDNVSLYQYNSIDLENNYADNLLDETFQNYKSYDVLSQTDTILEGYMVKIRIPDIDKLKLDRRSLPCKISQKKPESDMYQIGCKFGILDIARMDEHIRLDIGAYSLILIELKVC